MPLNNECEGGPSYLDSFPNRIRWQILVRTSLDHILSTDKVVGIYKDFNYKTIKQQQKQTSHLDYRSYLDSTCIAIFFTIYAFCFHIIIFLYIVFTCKT